MTYRLACSGLDGSNPLAYLAALGALRVLTLQDPNRNWLLMWEVIEGAWRPVLASNSLLQADELINDLARYLIDPKQSELLEQIGADLTITGRRHAFLAEHAVEKYLNCVHDGNDHQARVEVDFLAAFGCDAITNEDDRDSLIEDTAFRTMSGAGHQHFVQFMREIIANTDADHLRSTLFAPWNYADPGRGLNLRWDPADDRRYALRWKNPSNDPSMTMRGANRLAIEGLPIFTTAPMGNRLQTTGFTRRRNQGVRWTWPIWSAPLSLDCCRSLIQLAAIQPPPENDYRAVASWKYKMQQRGLAALFQSRRITNGKFRSFTPATAL